MNPIDAWILLGVAVGLVALMLREQRRANAAEDEAARQRKRAEEAEAWEDEHLRRLVKAQQEIRELQALNAEKTRLLMAKNAYLIEMNVRRRQQR